jgi:hypothetical protein
MAIPVITSRSPWHGHRIIGRSRRRPAWAGQARILEQERANSLLWLARKVNRDGPEPERQGSRCTATGGCGGAEKNGESITIGPALASVLGPTRAQVTACTGRLSA